MAMQAGLGASKILILVTAGVGGSIVLRNSKISDLVSDLSRALGNHLKEEGENSPGAGGGETANLMAQVKRLSNELRQLAAVNRPITVVNGSPSSGANLGALVLPAAVLGVAGYGYMWLRGWSLSDAMYVTRRNMSNAVTSMSKQLENVTSALATTRRQLSMRLDFMSRSLENNMSVTDAIQEQVGLVHGEFAQVGLEVKDINKHIESLEGKIDEVAGKQDYTITMLHQFAFQTPEHVEGRLQVKPKADRLISSPFLASSGLKELQSIQSSSERLLITFHSSPSDAILTNCSPNLQRFLTANGLGFLPSSGTGQKCDVADLGNVEPTGRHV